VGHLTREPFDAYRVVPAGLTEALLLTVAPVQPAQEPGESTEPAPRAGDRLITRRALETAWAPYADRANTRPLALVIRTRHELAPSGRPDGAAGPPPPYLTREAARLLVERGIEHLVIDLPSIDREHDAGRLTAHRIFFGLPANSRELAEATRRQATVTEFADIPDDLEDGSYLLAIHVPAWRGDAVPCRPLLYPFQQ
jgi:kynurenine formamidase